MAFQRGTGIPVRDYMHKAVIPCLSWFFFHRNYSTRYRPELELVLKDITMTIVCDLTLILMSGMTLKCDSVETFGENWNLWENGCWEVVCLSPLLHLLLPGLTTVHPATSGVI